MTDCPFCNLQKEQTRIIRITELTTVLLSNPRLMPGHTLVVPKRHVEKPWELTTNEIQAIFEDIFWIEVKLLENGAEGCDIRQNYRPFLAQSKIKINHVHFHVLPRTNKDELYKKSMKFEADLFKDLSNTERQEMARLLKD